ncbi:MAG: 8-amino-7-oxononanoate synthase [Spirochaetota bacterium]|nr:8-amino-7-oxononanoate synthase [Spirochaetota bacterium]
MKKAGLYRVMKNVRVTENQSIVVDGKSAVNFSSNDYLGFCQDKEILRLCMERMKDSGSGAGASRLISGNLPCHAELEEILARMKRKEKALVFGSGYLSNLALLSSLPGPGDLVLSDELNHASIIDGCRLSRGTVVTYPHKNMVWLKSYLEEHRDDYGLAFIVSDGVFSMDGDMVDLRELYKLALAFDLVPVIDEAHSTGVLGESGRGIESHYGLDMPSSIIMGTLGKALGSYGAFVCGTQKLIDFLVNRSRSFIYSTALNPPAVISATCCVEKILDDDSRVGKLWENIGIFKDCLADSGIKLKSDSAIFPVIVGESDKCMRLSGELIERGFFIHGIRPPTVPTGTARLRISLSATHKANDIISMTESLIELMDKYDVSPESPCGTENE